MIMADLPLDSFGSQSAQPDGNNDNITGFKVMHFTADMFVVIRLVR